MWTLKKLNIMGKKKKEVGRKSEHRECWRIPKRLVDENYKRKRVANLTGLSLERTGDIFKNMMEQ